MNFFIFGINMLKMVPEKVPGTKRSIKGKTPQKIKHQGFFFGVVILKTKSLIFKLISFSHFALKRTITCLLNINKFCLSTVIIF